MLYNCYQKFRDIFEDVGQAIPNEYYAFIHESIKNVFDAVAAKQAVGWPEVEFALYLLFMLGEKGQLQYFEKEQDVIVGLSPLGELVHKLVVNGIILVC